MNPFMLSHVERLLVWREFRLELPGFDEMEQLEKVATWWAKAPLHHYSIDWDNPENWPTPWELIHENSYCPAALAYLMHQTLALSGWDPNRLRVVFIRSEDDQRLVLVVDNRFVLNFSHGEIYDYEDIKETNRIIGEIIIDGDKRSLKVYGR